MKQSAVSSACKLLCPGGDIGDRSFTEAGLEKMSWSAELNRQQIVGIFDDMVSAAVWAGRTDEVVIDGAEEDSVLSLRAYEKWMQMKAPSEDSFIPHAPVKVCWNEIVTALGPPR